MALIKNDPSSKQGIQAHLPANAGQGNNPYLEDLQEYFERPDVMEARGLYLQRYNNGRKIKIYDDRQVEGRLIGWPRQGLIFIISRENKFRLYTTDRNIWEKKFPVIEQILPGICSITPNNTSCNIWFTITDPKKDVVPILEKLKDIDFL